MTIGAEAIYEPTNWREDIENYKNEVTQEGKKTLLFETQFKELDKKRLQEAAEFEKKESQERIQ